ncbi:hypothetical protein ACVWYH_001760 [Bradyrhizobium sp. GM24.11]
MIETLNDEAIERHKQALIEPAATLYAVQKVYGDQAKAKAMVAFGRLIDAHMLVTGVLASGLLRINGAIVEGDQTSFERDALFAAFVIGLEPCERAIAEARYLQAHAMLRQELEILAQLKAVRANRRKLNGAPNIAALEQSLARLYGGLSAAAHVSQHHIVQSATSWDGEMENLPGPTNLTRYFPETDVGLARRSYALHIYMVLRLVEELSIDLASRYDRAAFTVSENEALNLAIELMIAEGMLELIDAESAVS